MADREEGAAAVAVEHDAQRQQRVRGAPLDDDERGQQHGAGGEQADRHGIGPSRRVSACEKP